MNINVRMRKAQAREVYGPCSMCGGVSTLSVFMTNVDFLLCRKCCNVFSNMIDSADDVLGMSAAETVQLSMSTSRDDGRSEVFWNVKKEN